MTRYLWAFLFASATALPMSAQSLDAECRPTSIGIERDGEAGMELHPDVVWRRWLKSSSLLAMGDSIDMFFAARSGSLPVAWRIAMAAAIDTLRMELRRTVSMGDSPSAARFELTAQGDSIVLFQGETQAFSVTPATPVLHRVVVCHTALIARRIADYGGEAERQKNVGKARARVDRWSNFSQYGYSMLPLELVANDFVRFGRKYLESPPVQMILAHPSPGYTMTQWPWKKGASAQGLAFEWLGFLWYTPNRRHYFGASYMAIYPRDGRRSMGGMLHISPLGGRMGYVRAKDSTGKSYGMAVLSVDLYKFIQDRVGGSLSGEERAVRGLNQCVVSQGVDCR